jgi:hypothetical protein
MINKFTIRVTSRHFTFKCACYITYDIFGCNKLDPLEIVDDYHPLTTTHIFIHPLGQAVWESGSLWWRNEGRRKSERARAAILDSDLHERSNWRRFALQNEIYKEKPLTFQCGPPKHLQCFFFLEFWSRCLVFSALQSAASVRGCCKFGMDVRFWALWGRK